MKVPGRIVLGGRSSRLASMSTDRIAKDAAGVFELMFQVFKHQLELDEIERTNCALAKLGWGPTP
jgi:hypothetical protein